jgi:hypothetical protein
MTRVQALEEEIEKLSSAELVELTSGSSNRARCCFRKARQAVREVRGRSPRRQEPRDLKHFTSPDFWDRFSQLPEEIQRLARENYELLMHLTASAFTR